MGLSTLLLVVAIVSGVAGGVAARFRSFGTGIGDLLVGALVAFLIALLAVVSLVLSAGLDRFGVLHVAYLHLVVATPIAFLLISVPPILNVDHKTPIVAPLLLVIALGLIGAGIWGTHFEPRRLILDHQAMSASGATRPVLVGVLTDLHIDSVGDYERRVVDELIAAEPDLVIIAGDLYQIDDTDLSTSAPEVIGLLRRLVDGVGTVVIIEGQTEDPEVLSEMAEASGAIALQNEILDLDLGGQQLSVIGLRHPLGGENRPIEPFLVQQIADTYDRDDLLILVGHRPDTVLEVDDLPIDLVVSGHNHGGQIALPRVGPLFVSGDVGSTVAAGGFHLVDRTPIYVSTGAGLERGQAPQVRFRVRPSIGLITIVPNAA